MRIFNLKMTIFCYKKTIFNFKMRELSPKMTIIAQNGPKLPNSNRKFKNFSKIIVVVLSFMKNVQTKLKSRKCLFSIIF